MASRFGSALDSDFSDVRIHTGSEATAAASALGARAFTYGNQVGFNAGEYQPGTPVGDAIIAHELAHVEQQRHATATLDRARNAEQDEADEGHAFEDDADRAATGALAKLWGFAGTVANGAMTVPQRLRAARPRLQRCPQRVVRPDSRQGTPREQVERIIEAFQEAVRSYSPEEPPEDPLREAKRVLPEWKKAYDHAQRLIADELSNDAELSRRLQTSYQNALAALRRIQRDAPRVNVVLVAAPADRDDEFLRNATAYARSYFTDPPERDTVVVVEGVASLDHLFSAVEAAQPERLIRRVDIFSHGIGGATNELWMGDDWHTADDIAAALDARRFTSDYLQSASRFDTDSKVQIHGCRLGAGAGGEDFLETAGQALGGTQGQEVAGFTEWWFPRTYKVDWRGHPVTNTANDIYGDNAIPIREGPGSPAQRQANRDRFIDDFEAEAVRLFDRVVSGSQEVKSFLTADEQATGQVTRARKIEIMREMYDQNQAWLLGFLHPAGNPNADIADPAAALPRDDYTYTREHEAWEDRTVRVRVNP